MPGWIFSGYRGPEQPTPPPQPEPDAAEPTPPRETPWTNRTDMTGTCTCLAVYSTCRCTKPNISTTTKAADFRADQP